MDLSSERYGITMNAVIMNSLAISNVSMNFDTNLLSPIYQFLQCETPEQWVKKARQPENLPVLLRDHLLCELKAAQSAMFLIRNMPLIPKVPILCWHGLSLMKTLPIKKLAISTH
ncbi:tRNA hydroxylase [Xenorhabdus hominickii]|uniref:tRNA hydroxylase n=1 Tax=Xenorhabdus hominickii TaxID=351679 RepID=A0A2G0Q4B4_XENHO|nr:tRNA hydroxylase [Xenorhabdus hominickii]